jgi:hypothetical protein
MKDWRNVLVFWEGFFAIRESRDRHYPAGMRKSKALHFHAIKKNGC